MDSEFLSPQAQEILRKSGHIDNNKSPISQKYDQERQQPQYAQQEYFRDPSQQYDTPQSGRQDKKEELRNLSDNYDQEVLKQQSLQFDSGQQMYTNSINYPDNEDNNEQYDNNVYQNNFQQNPQVHAMYQQNQQRNSPFQSGRPQQYFNTQRSKSTVVVRKEIPQLQSGGEQTIQVQQLREQNEQLGNALRQVNSLLAIQKGQIETMRTEITHIQRNKNDVDEMKSEIMNALSSIRGDLSDLRQDFVLKNDIKVQSQVLSGSIAFQNPVGQEQNLNTGRHNSAVLTKSKESLKNRNFSMQQFDNKPQDVANQFYYQEKPGLKNSQYQDHEIAQQLTTPKNIIPVGNYQMSSQDNYQNAIQPQIQNISEPSTQTVQVQQIEQVQPSFNSFVSNNESYNPQLVQQQQSMGGNQKFVYICSQNEEIKNFKSYLIAKDITRQASDCQNSATIQEFIEQVDCSENTTCIFIVRSSESILSAINTLLKKINAGFNNSLIGIILKSNEDDLLNESLYRILTKKVLIVDYEHPADNQENMIKEFFQSIGN